MDLHSSSPSSSSLLQRLTFQFTSKSESDQRLLTMEPMAATNTDIKDPSHDIDKEITALENLIRKLQTEIFQMSQSASNPLEDYMPNFEEYNDTPKDTREDILTKTDQEPNSFDSFKGTFKKLWNDSKSATTSNSVEQNFKNDTELEGKTGNKYFDDDYNFNYNVSILKDYIDANKTDFEQLEDKNNNSQKHEDENKSKPLNDEQNEPKTPSTDEKILEQPVNNNTKFGILMRVFGNTSTSDERIGVESSSADSIGQKVLETLHITKSKSEPSINMSSKRSDTAFLDDSSINIISTNPKVKPYTSENMISKVYGEVNTNNDFDKSNKNSNPAKNIDIKNLQTPQHSNETKSGSSSMQIHLNSDSKSTFVKPKKDYKKLSNKSLINKTDDSETAIPQKVSIINIYIDLPKQNNSKQQEDSTKTIVLKTPKSKTSVPSTKQGGAIANTQIKDNLDSNKKSSESSNCDISQSEIEARPNEVNRLKSQEIKKSNTIFDMASRFLNTYNIKDLNMDPEQVKHSKSSLNSSVSPLKNITKLSTDKTIAHYEEKSISNVPRHESDCNIDILPMLDVKVVKKTISNERPIVQVDLNQVAEKLVSENINNEEKLGYKTVSLTIIEPEKDDPSKNQTKEANENIQINDNESDENVSFENEDFTDEYESLADDDENESLFEESFHTDCSIIINNNHITINNGDNQSDIFEDSQDFTGEAVPRDNKLLKKK